MVKILQDGRRVANISNDLYACSSIACTPEDTERYVQNSVKLYHLRTPNDEARGCTWFPQAHNFARDYAQARGWDVRIAFGVMSLFTQTVSWSHTLTSTQRFLDGIPLAKCGHPLANRPAFKAKVQGILDNPENAHLFMGKLKKIPAMHAGIVTSGHTDTIAIDRWMARAFIGVRVDKISVRLYRYLESIWAEALVRINAERATQHLSHLWGAQAQACIWLVIKESPDWARLGQRMQAAPEWIA